MQAIEASVLDAVNSRTPADPDGVERLGRLRCQADHPQGKTAEGDNRKHKGVYRNWTKLNQAGEENLWQVIDKYGS